jgi:uncharacterized damage-inducible protein DinB
MTEVIAGQFQASMGVTLANINGITHEDSVKQPQPAGNCLNWVLGHIMGARNSILSLLGEKPMWEEGIAAPYQRHGEALTDSSKAVPWDKLVGDFKESQEILLGALPKLTPERLAEKAPFSPTNNPNETIGSLLATFAFHEAYHAGQTGVLRRIAGKPAADL